MGWPGGTMDQAEALAEPPRERHFGPIHMAETMDLLMRTLGYTNFVAQGGDWGSGIATSLAKLRKFSQENLF